MSEQEKRKLAAYLVRYLLEEAERGNPQPDKWTMFDALAAYFGGAADQDAA